MPEKKDSIFDPAPTAAVEETTAPDAPEEAPTSDAAPEEVKVPTVKLALSQDYDGPEPVYVSAEGHDRVEVPGEVPADVAPSFTNFPFVEVAE